MVANQSSNFFENLKRFKREGEDIQAFMARVGMPRPAWYDWADGTDPKLSTASTIADRLGVSVDKLARWRDPDIEDALPGWSQLSDDQKAQIRGFVQTLVEAGGGEVALPKGASTAAERAAIERARKRAKRQPPSDGPDLEGDNPA